MLSSGAPEEIRTPDPQIRSLVLDPAAPAFPAVRFSSAHGGTIKTQGPVVVPLMLQIYFRFSNRPVRVKHFQTIRRCSVDVTSLIGRLGSSTSLIGRLGSSTFRLSAAAVSMSLTGSCFSSESAPGPFHHGIRRRGGTIFRAALPSDERQVQAEVRTHLIHRPARDIFPPRGGTRVSSYRI